MSTNRGKVRKSSVLLHSSSLSQTKKSSLLVWGSNRNKKRITHKAPKKGVRVLNDEGKDVTPLPLYRAAPGDESQPGRHFLDEISTSSGSDYLLRSTSSSSVLSCSSFMGSSQRYTATSLTTDSEDSVLQLDKPINHPATSEVTSKRDDVKEHLTEEMLDEVVNICITETDIISLLDIPSTFVSDDADDAEAIKERNFQYAELCKNKLGNDKYMARSTQTFNEAPKDKQIQTEKIAAVDEETIASVCDIHDSFANQNKTLESGETADFPETTMNTSKGQEKRGQQSSSCSTVCMGSTSSSQLEMETCGNSLQTDSDLQLIMLSESFKSSLLVMERSIVANAFQTKLAAYKQLPTLEDPDSTVKPGTEEQSEEGAESSSPPTLEHVLAFTCTLTRGCNITSMAWNKKNPDILAVGYGDFDSRNKKPSLICCWCLKNLTWPERVIHCHSCVISLDFSANNPSQLAVGMDDGTMAIYDVSQYDVPCIADSRNCVKKHLHPVWQVNWIKQGMTTKGQVRAEALISVSADGRISKWFLCSDGLDCLDLMKKKAEKKKTEQVLPFMGNPGLCVDFHPTDYSIYVVGTWEGLIHRGSVSNNQHFLDTYQQHFCPVNHIEWSPFNSDMFLSCSSDWTIQLWRKDLSTPVLSFTSTQMAVHAVKWSPNWSTVFAAHNGEQVEIWDLNLSTVYPSIVHHAAAGVKVTSLLFTRGIDGVLVGDSDGQVTVYRIKNLNVGEDNKVDGLGDIINSAGSLRK